MFQAPNYEQHTFRASSISDPVVLEDLAQSDHENLQVVVVVENKNLYQILQLLESTPMFKQVAFVMDSKVN